MRLQFLDHYSLLRVSQNATASELEHAYRVATEHAAHGWKPRLVAKLTGRTAGRLLQAYEELSNPERRASYDEYLARSREMGRTLLR